MSPPRPSPRRHLRLIADDPGRLMCTYQDLFIVLWRDVVPGSAFFDTAEWCANHHKEIGRQLSMLSIISRSSLRSPESGTMPAQAAHRMQADIRVGAVVFDVPGAAGKLLGKLPPLLGSLFRFDIPLTSFEHALPALTWLLEGREAPGPSPRALLTEFAEIGRLEDPPLALALPPTDAEP